MPETAISLCEHGTGALDDSTTRRMRWPWWGVLAARENARAAAREAATRS